MSQIEKFYGTNTVTYLFSVEEHHDGMRLDKFIQIYFDRQSREFIKKKIVHSEITISNRQPPHRPSTKVHHGEQVTMIIHRPDGERELYFEHWNNQPLEIDRTPKIIFEDENILIINKPPFMTTHPTGRHFFNCATSYFQSIYQKTIHSVHRLDRETSGILVLTKKPVTATRLSEYFLNRQVKKCYFLIAHKSFSQEQMPSFPFSANERLAVPQGEDARLFMEVHPQTSSKGKNALTHFELLFENEHYLLALAFPHTGRQHQIRAHAAHHGFPLVGDKIYHGGIPLFKRYKDNLTTLEDYQLMEVPRQSLHAMALSIPYPLNDQASTYIAPLPQDLLEWIQSKLKLDLVLLYKKIDEIIANSFMKFEMFDSEEEFQDQEDD